MTDRSKRQRVSSDAPPNTPLEQKSITLQVAAHPGNLVHFLRYATSNYTWTVDAGEYTGHNSETGRCRIKRTIASKWRPRTLTFLDVQPKDVVGVVNPTRANQVAPESDQSEGSGGGGDGVISWVEDAISQLFPTHDSPPAAAATSTTVAVNVDAISAFDALLQLFDFIHKSNQKKTPEERTAEEQDVFDQREGSGIKLRSVAAWSEGATSVHAFNSTTNGVIILFITVPISETPASPGGRRSVAVGKTFAHAVFAPYQVATACSLASSFSQQAKDLMSALELKDPRDPRKGYQLNSSRFDSEENDGGCLSDLVKCVEVDHARIQDRAYRIDTVTRACATLDQTPRAVEVDFDGEMADDAPFLLPHEGIIPSALG